MSLEQIRKEQPVSNTLHNLIPTLSVKLDSAARYGLYQDDARKDGAEECEALFRRLGDLERKAIDDLVARVSEQIGQEDRAGLTGSRAGRSPSR